MSAAASSHLSRLRTQIETMRALARRPDEDLHRGAPQVSGWCPAEHLDHLNKVSTAVLLRIASGEKEPLAKGISPIGRLILFLGWIPRGKGKAPERMRGTTCTGADLLAALEKQEEALTRVEAMTVPTVAIVPHPRFGGLTPIQALRFLAVHNDHHLKIISDVERQR